MREGWCRGDRRLSDNKWDASCLWRPPQCATVGNGTKIWSANLRLDKIQCLILPLLHFTIKGVQIYMFSSHPFGGLISTFTPSVYERRLGLTLDMQTLFFSADALMKKLLEFKANGSHHCCPGSFFCKCWTLNFWWSNSLNIFKEYLEETILKIEENMLTHNRQTLRIRTLELLSLRGNVGEPS